jgi:hypothetical protein
LPIVVTFDLSRPTPRELNSIRGAFERLGWEHLGNTAYRYPRLRDAPQTEDWLNQVAPARMLTRALARRSVETGRVLVRYSIDVQSSTGFNQEANIGTPALSAEEIDFLRPSRSGERMGQGRLRGWLDGIGWPDVPPVADSDAGH